LEGFCSLGHTTAFEVGLVRPVYANILGTLQALRDEKGADAWRAEMTQLGNSVKRYMGNPLTAEKVINVEEIRDE
jgi:predicted secreted protein